MTEETRTSWKSTATHEVLSAWWSWTNPQKALLETVINEKGAQKYEVECSQKLVIVTRLRPKIAAAFAEYTTEHPSREFLDEININTVATALYSVEQLLMCLRDLYLL